MNNDLKDSFAPMYQNWLDEGADPYNRWIQKLSRRLREYVSVCGPEDKPALAEAIGVTEPILGVIMSLTDTALDRLDIFGYETMTMEEWHAQVMAEIDAKQVK